jgi:hypothetical protein
MALIGFGTRKWECSSTQRDGGKWPCASNKGNPLSQLQQMAHGSAQESSQKELVTAAQWQQMAPVQ